MILAVLRFSMTFYCGPVLLVLATASIICHRASRKSPPGIDKGQCFRAHPARGGAVAVTWRDRPMPTPSADNHNDSKAGQSSAETEYPLDSDR